MSADGQNFINILISGVYLGLVAMFQYARTEHLGSVIRGLTSKKKLFVLLKFNGPVTSDRIKPVQPLVSAG